MLWASELKPRNWWTDDFSLVGICVELLHDLALWLTEARCPHYFINYCNLVDDTFDLEMMAGRLASISKSRLLWWFVNNYIRRCSKLCPPNVSRLFDANTTLRLQNAVSAIVDWRVNTGQHEIFEARDYVAYAITMIVSKGPYTGRSLAICLTEWRQISESSPVYFLSVALLHVACETQRSGLNDMLMDVLAAVVGQSVGRRIVPLYSSRQTGACLLRKAADVMKAVDDSHKPRSTVQLIAIELSKAYLYRALSFEDSVSDPIFCLANVYLAVLHYATGKHQTAIDHCTLVTRSPDHSLSKSRVVHGELLPKTDDDIDIVSGLAVFYQHVRMAALNQQQQPQHVTVFTTEVFAHYLHMKCLSVTKCQQPSDTTNSQSLTSEVQSYMKYINDTSSC